MTQPSTETPSLERIVTEPGAVVTVPVAELLSILTVATEQTRTKAGVAQPGRAAMWAIRTLWQEGRVTVPGRPEHLDRPPPRIPPPPRFAMAHADESYTARMARAEAREDAPSCARCGQRESAAVHVSKDGHGFAP
jgi:hypothetical protein